MNEMDKPALILEAALKLFVEFGFHGTPTSRIAADAGVSNGTLFHYFKTKDELVAALYIQEKNSLNDFMESEIRKFFTVKEMFFARISSPIRWALANKEAFYFIHQVNYSPHIYLIDEATKKKYLRIHEELLGMAISQNLLKPIDPILLGTLVSSHVLGTFQYLEKNEFPLSKQNEVIQEVSELTWKMISNLEA